MISEGPQIWKHNCEGGKCRGVAHGKGRLLANYPTKPLSRSWGVAVPSWGAHTRAAWRCDRTTAGPHSNGILAVYV